MNKKKQKISKGIIENDDLSRFDNAFTLDELMGASSPNLYGAKTSDEFEKKIQGMSLLELHKMAVKVGLVPVHDRGVMKKRLKASFAKYVKSLRPFKQSKNRFYSEGQDDKNGARARELLSRGK